MGSSYYGINEKILNFSFHLFSVTTVTFTLRSVQTEANMVKSFTGQNILKKNSVLLSLTEN